jgi:hypothetical protein
MILPRTDPLDPLDPWVDTDADGLHDFEENNIYGTNPEDADTDNDTWSDKDEIDAGTDPLDPNDYPGATTSESGVILVPTLIFLALSLSVILFTYRKRRRVRWSIKN